MSKYDGFIEEFYKSAYKQTFIRGAKQSIPWTLGFEALESATKPPHLSLETPRDKTKRLAKNLAAGAVGFGSWDVISKALKRKKAPETLKNIYRKGLKKGGKSAARKGVTKAILKRFPRGAAVLGASLGGSILAEDLISKLFGTEAPKEYPLQYLRK